MLLHDIWEKTTFEIRHMQKYPHFYSFLMLGVSTYMPIFFSRFKTSKSEPDIPNSHPAI